MSENTAQDIRHHLASKGLIPSTVWLDNFLSTTRQAPTIKQTAWFRLLGSDITHSLDHSRETEFPADVLDGKVKQRILKGPIPVQVLDIEDVGRSKWSQVEAIEAEERGETTKGREIIRVVPGETDGNGSDQGNVNVQSAKGSSGPHKLTLQDARGALMYGFEMGRVEGVSVTSLSIGAKLLLRDVAVARGVLLLDSRSCTVLGGKIDTLHKEWKDGRKDRLKAQARAERGQVTE